MTGKSNPHNFWEEFRRRKTGKVIVSYAATAFILLQLADILTPALLLPGWTTRLVTFLLMIGFPAAVAFSWMFDITPHGIVKTKPVKPGAGKRKFKGEDLVVAILLVLVVILAYPRFFGSKPKIIRDPDGKVSIAVNTFENLTGDSTINSWKMGISELLIYNLGTSNELSVQSTQTMLEVYKGLQRTQNASMGATVQREAAIKLKAGGYITGNYQKAGNKIRIIAKLTDTESDNLVWTGKVDGDIESDYISMADQLSKQLKDFLELKALRKNTVIDFRDAFTGSADAYRKYNEGISALMNEDYPEAIALLSEAYRIDSTFAMAAFYIANAYNAIGADNSSSEIIDNSKV